MIDTDPREIRLPLWARTYIERLRRERDRAVRAADEARLATEPAASNAIIHPYADTPIGLGSPRVRFKVGDEDRAEWIDVEVTRDHRGRAYLTVHGGTTLVVLPQVTNLVHVEVRHR